MKELHVLSLGAGVQSTTLYLMFMRGVLTPQIDCAIFADTGEEPTPVYRHLDWLLSLGGPQILVRSVGRLGNDLQFGRNSTGQRFASIPAYTTDVPGLPKAITVPFRSRWKSSDTFWQHAEDGFWHQCPGAFNCFASP
jgi:hypothetical protein